MSCLHVSNHTETGPLQRVPVWYVTKYLRILNYVPQWVHSSLPLRLICSDQVMMSLGLHMLSLGCPVELSGYLGTNYKCDIVLNCMYCIVLCKKAKKGLSMNVFVQK